MMLALMVLGFLGLAAGGFMLFRGLDGVLAEEKARGRSPFGEKLLRPAGESLRLRIDSIIGEMVLTIVKLCGCLAAPTFVPPFLRELPEGSQLALWCSSCACACLAALHYWKRLKGHREDLRNHRLGFHGERYMAEKLTALTALGWRVYHDFIFDMKPGGDATTFNIDHVVVGPRGVFAIETKTWRKPNGPLPPGEERQRVTVSGDTLRLPGGYQVRKPLEQARRNAADLSSWLTGSAERPAPVFPVVVMPGWFVQRERAWTVPVLSGKAVAKMLPHLGAEGALTAAQIRTLADRIEAHCRNVEEA